MFAAAPGPHGAVRGPVGVAAARPLTLLVGLLVGLLVALLVGVVIAGAQVAMAHTDIEFTLPTDGAVVGEPVREITVGFDDRVTLIGPGFEVLDPQGNILIPFVATDDDIVFRLQIDPPIGGGDAAVRYEVRAEDGHTISGGFVFTILADAPTTVAATTTTAATITIEPTIEPTTDPTTPVMATSRPATEPGTTVPEATEVAGPTATATATVDEGSSTGTYVAITVVVVVIAGAFVAFRSRADAP